VAGSGLPHPKRIRPGPQPVRAAMFIAMLTLTLLAGFIALVSWAVLSAHRDASLVLEQ
jgi:hypothetical protein